jgi:hypothetical protein
LTRFNDSSKICSNNIKIGLQNNSRKSTATQQQINSKSTANQQQINSKSTANQQEAAAPSQYLRFAEGLCKREKHSPVAVALPCCPGDGP